MYVFFLFTGAHFFRGMVYDSVTEYTAVYWACVVLIAVIFAVRRCAEAAFSAHTQNMTDIRQYSSAFDTHFL